MARTNIDVDEAACAEVMRRYSITTKRAAVNFALRTLAAEPLSVEEARRMRGSGWDADLDELRSRRTAWSCSMNLTEEEQRLLDSVEQG